MKKLLPFLLLLLVALVGCDDDDSTSPNTSDQEPGITFSTTTLEITQGNSESFSLQSQHFDGDVFAISFQLLLSDTTVAILNSDQITAGPCFGDDALLFAQRKETAVYVAITRIQGDESFQEDGDLLELEMDGLVNGECNLSIPVDHLVLYDLDGQAVETAEQTTLEISIAVTD